MDARVCVRETHECDGVVVSFPPLLLVQRRTQQQEQLSIRYKEMINCQTLPNRGEQVWLALQAC